MSRLIAEFFKAAALSILVSGVLFWLGKQNIHPEVYVANILDIGLPVENTVSILVFASVFGGVALALGFAFSVRIFQLIGRPPKELTIRLRQAAIDLEQSSLNSALPSGESSVAALDRFERIATEFRSYRGIGPIIANTLDTVREYVFVASEEYATLNGSDDNRESQLRASSITSIERILHATRWVAH